MHAPGQGAVPTEPLGVPAGSVTAPQAPAAAGVAGQFIKQLSMIESKTPKLHAAFIPAPEHPPGQGTLVVVP